MEWSDVIKLIHIAIAFAFISGLIGRWILLHRAAAAENPEIAYQLSQASSPFEWLVVRGGPAILVAGLLTAWAQGYPWLGLTTGWMLASVVLLLSPLPFVPLVFMPRGRIFEAAMAEARRLGAVTPELRAAFADPAIAFGHRFEAVRGPRRGPHGAQAVLRSVQRILNVAAGRAVHQTGMNPSPSPRLRPITRIVAAAALAALTSGLSACEPNAEIDESPPAPGPSSTIVPDASAATLEQLAGPWRPEALPLDEAVVETVRSACVDAADPVQSFGPADQPVVVVDARGLSLVSVVLADDFAAFECRMVLAAEGTSATAIEAPSRLDGAALAPLEDATIEVVAHTRVDEPSGSRTLLIGRVGPKATAVGVTVVDRPEIVAANANGWFLAWWPGPAEPAAVVSSDLRNVVLDDVSNPEKQVEGRVALAAWWIDPAAERPGAGSTEINALVLELSCASGGLPEGRILEPTIFASEDAALVTFFVRRLPGEQDCIGNEPLSVRFSLPEPLGDRRLLDGSAAPPRDATTPGQ